MAHSCEGHRASVIALGLDKLSCRAWPPVHCAAQSVTVNPEAKSLCSLREFASSLGMRGGVGEAHI